MKLLEAKINRLENSDFALNRQDFDNKVLREFRQANPGLALALT